MPGLISASFNLKGSKTFPEQADQIAAWMFGTREVRELKGLFDVARAFSRLPVGAQLLITKPDTM